MMKMNRFGLRATVSTVVLVFLVSAPSPSRGQQAETIPKNQPTRLQQAREAFDLGLELYRMGRSADAVLEVERAIRLYPQHALPYFYLALWQRDLGQLTRAKMSLESALERDQELAQLEGDVRGRLSADEVRRTKELQAIIQDRLSVCSVTVDPPDARVLIDGAPLHVVRLEKTPLLMAGVEAPLAGGNPEGLPVPAASFELEMDPGRHYYLARANGRENGFEAFTTKSGPCALTIQARQRPAVLSVQSTPLDASVRVDGVAIGKTPALLERSAGRYALTITAPGFIPHEALIELQSGHTATVSATLSPEVEPLTSKWWFWSIIGAAVVGVGTATYFGVRPAPAPPPYDGGSLGWVVRVP